MTLKKADLKTQDSRIAVMTRANGRNPLTHRWGFFGQDDGMSGAGGFVWFSTREDLLDALVEAEPAIYYEPASPEFQKARVALERLRTKILAEKGLSPVARQKVNVILKGAGIVQWWGTVDELFEGNGKFARGLREMFRPDEDDSKSDSRPIPPSERKEFIRAFSEYGS